MSSNSNTSNVAANVAANAAVAQNAANAAKNAANAAAANAAVAANAAAAANANAEWWEGDLPGGVNVWGILVFIAVLVALVMAYQAFAVGTTVAAHKATFGQGEEVDFYN